MLDRAIGIAGIALALIFGLWSTAPEGWPKAPAWLMMIGIGFGIFLFGLAAGLIINEKSRIKTTRNEFIFNDFPPSIVVSKEKFINERIILDGKSYIDCEFENVTFVFNGTAPFSLMNNKFNGRIQVASDNPAISGSFALLRGLGYLDNVDFLNKSKSIIELPKRR